MRLNKTYLILAVITFIIEVFIVLYVRDNFFRPYFGDFLVVILIYCSIKAFINIPYKKAAIGVLMFSYTIEALQYINFVEAMGWQTSVLARTIIGTSFSWHDLWLYTAGIFVVLFVEAMRERRNVKPRLN